MRIITKNKEKIKEHRVKLNRADNGYQEAWQRFQRVSAQLHALWKTKKNSLQILKSERAR